jgi:hypothetical protein
MDSDVNPVAWSDTALHRTIIEESRLSMGVYIKNMVMPDSCLDCPLYNGYGCKATMQMFHPVTNVGVRVDSCPLVEVTEPHGRLIDADVCKQRVYDGSRTPYKTCPTVIEAEGERRSSK